MYTNHPEFCHVKCTMKPSMRAGTYHVYLFLGREGALATCECAPGYVASSPPPQLTPHVLLFFLLSLCIHHMNRKSANCTHVSAVLHALAGLNLMSFQLRPNLPAASDDDDDVVPVTSLPCQWKAPKKLKESTPQISEATFEKHDYAKPVKRKIKRVKDFDPRPPQFRGTEVDFQSS